LSARVDVIIAGAGVVGLAIAKTLAERGRDVWVLDAATSIGTGASSRNSEVIHAGLYYPKDSLKARLCVEGRRLLYDYCRSRKIDHCAIGKLIVATNDDETATLRSIQEHGAANGVDDLVQLSQAEVRRYEPALRTVGALWSPSSGIIDSHALMFAYQGDAEAAGATIVCRAPIVGGEITETGVALTVGGDTPMHLSCRLFINCAGLGAVDLARKLIGFPASAIPPAYLCKGSYFSLNRRSPFRHLIYPVPEPGGLGVHATLDLGGQTRFGPDVEWTDRIDYGVEQTRAARFYPTIRRYWPDLPDDALQPAYSGIRAKITGPGEPSADFRIDGPEQHGIPGVIHLFGIESPGLTASLAIGAHVATIVALRLA